MWACLVIINSSERP
ncbi:rCG44316, partial [Rattus norvegicus]